MAGLWLSCSAVSNFVSRTGGASHPPPLTSKHWCLTSTHHVKYFHGGKQDLRLKVSFLLAGGIVWRSLEVNPGLRQQPHSHDVHSVPTRSLCLAHMLILPLLGVWAANSSQLPLLWGTVLC